MNKNRSALSGFTAAILIAGIIGTFAFGGFNLPIFFATLAFFILFSAISTGKPGALYGGYSGFVWMFALAMFFTLNPFWNSAWIIFPIAVVLMGAIRPLVTSLIAGLTSLGVYSQPVQRPPQQAYYQPPQPAPQQPYYQPPQQPAYQQGYQQQPANNIYQEGGQSYPYPPQAAPAAEERYSQPQSQYPPQQLPPIQ